MQHPGPPRFSDVGESINLAPRAPDTDAHYRWHLHERPEGSDVTIGDGPVVNLTPDLPGVYELELDSPTGRDIQQIRAFETVREEVEFRVSDEEVDVDPEAVNHVTVFGKFNDFTMGTHYAERDGDGWTFETALQPGVHDVTFAFDDGFEPSGNDDVTVEGPGRPRLSLNHHIEDNELVLIAETDVAPGGSEPDVVFELDDRDPLTWDDVTVNGAEIRIPRDALPVTSRVHAVPVAERHGIADTVRIKDANTGITVEQPGSPPEWVRDATIYEIFVREFAGEGLDTTFTEIEKRVPYIESLGVDAVWFTPVCASPTRHGYHITDLFGTATDLGTRSEFESLVEALHDADIKVLFDLVVNHTSRDHSAFHLHRAGVPEYENYYERTPRDEDATEVNWAGEDAPGYYFNWSRIPNLNYDSLAVRSWILDVVDQWADLVDGFRCDVAWGVPHSFWKEVRARLKARDSEFVLLDETVPREVAFRENEFDVHYDTDLYGTLRDIGNGEAEAEAIFDALANSQRRGFPENAAHMRYVENHDEDRYHSECGTTPLRAAVGATFTLPGVPMIYYGQESGVEDYRGPMLWYDGDADLTNFHRSLVSLRNKSDALRRADVTPIEYEVRADEPDKVVAFGRADLVVALNFGEDSAVVEIPRLTGTTDLVTDTERGTDNGVQVDDIAVFTAGDP